MEFVCQYTILGVEAGASSEQISAAYLALLASARNALASGKPMPIERLDAIRTAYRTLSSADLRRKHDVRRAAAVAEEAIARAVSNGVAAVVAPRAPAAPEAAALMAREAQVEFRGSGAEYFRIWLVNIALTLVTLGIYSAWAKVRREKYFHRNMVVDGSAFDYHGTPRALLIGRCIFALFLILVSLADHFAPKFKLVTSLLLVIAFPWLLVQSMRFRARNTSYRGIRFAFSGKYRNVLFLFLVHGGLCLLTLGLYFPAFLQKQKAFVARHLSYGNTALSFDCGIGAFYRGLAFPLIIWCLALASIAAYGGLLLTGDRARAAVLVMMYGVPTVILLLMLVQLIVFPYARVVGTNLLWNHLRVGRARFCSTQKVRSYIGITLSNWLLTLLTIGFFWPVGQVRLARFRARNLALIAAGALTEVTAREQRDAPALGSETMAAFDFDIAL